MDNMNERKEAVIAWIKKPANILLVLILLFAFGIRLYYFNLASGQALWWDEAEYGSTSKMWALDVPYNINPQRPPLFQFLGAIAIMMGLGEGFMKFAFVLLPSLFLVFAVYLLGKEMYNRKIGLIGAFLTAVSWTFLFWTPRLQPDFFSMCFQVLAVLFMWKYWKHGETKPIIWAGIFAAIGFYFKVSALLVPLTFMAFILIKDRFSAFFNKKYYYFSAAYLLTLVPYFIWSYITFGTFTAFKSGYSNAFISATPTPFAWYTLRFFYTLSENVLFVLFILGVILSLKFVLYLDVLAKDKNRCFDAGIFNLLIFVIVAAFYVFYIRGAEDRWVFLWLPFMFFAMGDVLVTAYEFGKKYSKYLSAIVIIGVLLFGGYMQVKHADEIIKVKKDSYMPVKQGCEWIKANSEKGDIVMTGSYTQTVYYTERNVTQIPDNGVNSSKMDEFIWNNRPKYLIVSLFERHPAWIQGWIDKNQARLLPVDAYFLDESKTQVALVVYQLKY